MARSLGDTLLRPAAERCDVEGVPRSHLDALAAEGLFGIAAPADAGGSDLALTVQRAVAEELAAADASTWFVWTQHHTPVRTVLRSPDPRMRAEWLPRLARGESVAGVAFTHLRRPRLPVLTATRTSDGFKVSGDIAWLTSWQLADVFLIGAQAGDDVVWMLVDLYDRPGVSAEPLGLAAMTGTATVRVRLHDLVVSADEVVLVEPVAEWRAADAARTVDTSAAVFGVTRDALRRLRERDDDASVTTAAAMQGRLDELRASAYALADDPDASAHVEERLAVRAQAHALACASTAALVTAGAGRAMLLDAAAQRLARTALFLLVQGQTAAVREATLRAFAGGSIAQ